MLQNVEKVHNFLRLPRPSPRNIWTFLNLVKIGNLMTPPPPSDLIWEHFEIKKFSNFGNPLSLSKIY